MDQASPVASLLSLVDKEMDRLARAQAIDARAELQHHVWPLMKELLLQIDGGDDESEAWIPPEFAARLMGAIAQLAMLAERALPAEQRPQLSQDVGTLIQEIASITDEEEVAALINSAPPPPAKAPEVPAAPQVTIPPASTPAPSSPESITPPPPSEVNRE